MKGFPNGLPMVAMPYIETMQLNPEELAGTPQEQTPVMKRGGELIRSLKQGGETKKVRITNLAKYDDGGGIPKDATVVKSKEEAIALVEQGKVPADKILIQTGEGKYQKLKKSSTISKDYDFGELDPNVKKHAGEDAAKAYNYMRDVITKNPKLQDDIVKNYHAKLETLKPGKTLTQAHIDAAKNMQPKEIVDNFLEMQKQVYVAKNIKGTKANWDPEQTWDKGSRNSYYNFAKEYGFKPLDENQATSFQTSFNVLNDLAQLPEYQETLGQFTLRPVGYSDEPGSHTAGKTKGESNISDIDSWVGNTTILEGMTPKAERYDVEDYTPEVIVEKKEEEGDQPLYASDYAPWWLQDTIATQGAVGDFYRIKKEQPWQAAPEYTYPKATFYDPERELAANAENAMIAANELSQFTGPQSFNARYNQIQGAGAKNAADILSRYNNLNVGVSNQLDAQVAGIKTQASASKAANATQLHDKYAIVNQQFTNAKNQARQEIRNKLIQAITNRATTQSLNSLQ
jgi:hypothetical protein